MNPLMFFLSYTNRINKSFNIFVANIIHEDLNSCRITHRENSKDGTFFALEVNMKLTEDVYDKIDIIFNKCEAFDKQWVKLEDSMEIHFNIKEDVFMNSNFVSSIIAIEKFNL